MEPGDARDLVKMIRDLSARVVSKNDSEIQIIWSACNAYLSHCAVWMPPSAERSGPTYSELLDRVKELEERVSN